MSDQTTVVVGSAQGIGAVVARRLAAQNESGRLVLADVRFEAVKKLAAELGAGGLTVDAVHCDITSQPSIDALVENTGDATRVALVAGVFQAKPSDEVTAEEMDRILRVNLVGTFFVDRKSVV